MSGDRNRWLLARRTGIGSSDAPGVCGVSKWSSPFSIYAEKTDEGELVEEQPNPLFEWGRRMEPLVAEWYADLSGRSVHLWEPYTLAWHGEREWMIATPDALQAAPDRPEDGLLEIKAPLPWTADEWEREPPLPYQVQLQHQLEVTGHAWGTLVVQFPGELPRWWDFERHEELIAAMVATEERLWRCVESRTPPPPDGAQATADALQRMHRRQDEETTVILPGEAETWDARLAEIKAEAKALAAERAELENRITAQMGEATFGLIPGVAGRFKWARRKGSSKRTLTRVKR